MSTINEVLTPDQPHPTSPHHTANGKFAPGNALGGRKKRSEEAALLAALDAALPADKLAEHMKLCVEWAKEFRSGKMLLSLWQFKFNYIVGQPVQRSISASGKLENILDRMRDMDEDEFAEVEQAMRDE